MQPAPATAVSARTDDAELVRLITAGDHAACRELMRRHNQRLYRTARAILKDDTEAEDAVQEAYLLAFRAMDNFRGDAKLSTWLTRIVANEALGRLRKRTRAAEVIPFDTQYGDSIEVAIAAEDDMNPQMPNSPTTPPCAPRPGACSRRRSTSCPMPSAPCSCCAASRS